MTRWIFILFVFAAAAQSAAAAADGVVTLSAGADHSSGAYGKSETTDVSLLHFGAKYDTGRWTFRGSLPFLRISGPASVVGIGPDVVVLPGESDGRRDVSGLGDVVASAGYKLIAEPTAPLQVDVLARVKLATADEAKGLGTGENDYSLQVDVATSIGAATPFATLGYRWFGDPPGIELRNALFGSLGIAWRDGSGTTVGAAYDFRQPIVDGGARASELMVFFSRPVAPEWKLQLYFVRGFSDASPDAGVGAILGYTY